MKHFLLFTAIMAMCSPSLTAGGINANRPVANQAAFRFMPKAGSQHVFGVREDADAGVKVRAAARLVQKTLPESDTMGFLDTPDGEQWYYVGQYTKNNGAIKHFSFTVYDSQFQELTTIEDDVVLAENETRVIDVQLGELVTRKFFNNDDNPEFMVAFAANTPEYVNHYYTKVYSGGAAESIGTFEGYWCTDVNASTDSWSENFYIGFMTEQETTQSEIGGVINSMDYVIDIYKKAGYSSSCQSVHQIRIPSLLSSGESWIPVLALAHDGNACFATSYLKYSYYENPYDYNNETPTADNELVVDFYEVPRYGSPSLTYQTRIPTAGSASDMNFYYLGAFMYDGDVTYGRYTSDDAPSFTITRAHYETSSDGYSYSYDIYPAGTEENPYTEKILTLGENIDGATMMSDVRGYAPQVCFIRESDENYTFDFVNLLDGKVECSLPYNIIDNITMNAGVDRVAGNGSPLYVVAQYTADSDEEGNAIEVVAYVNPDGSLHHADRLNIGQNVAYANVFTSAYALDPYIFNTDTEREYMVLVKRYLASGSSSTREELMVVSPSKGILLNLLPDEELGNISFVELDERSEHGQNLHVVYQTTGFRFNTVRYELPLTKFAGGDGSVDNPYRIATLGDLRQVKFSPSANYVLEEDIDARGVEMEHVTADFTGTFDGGGHSIIGPDLDGQGLFKSVTGGEGSTGGVINNLNILQPNVTLADNAQTGILANDVVGAKITNVFIYDAAVKGETSEVRGTFGGIVGSAALYSEISGSAVIGADINLPESSVGGIAGIINASTAIKSCSFKGNIAGGKEVGGVAGNTNADGDRIEDCHVDAVIVAKNTIGGVAGSSNRGVIRRCHVQGSIEATEAPMWGGGPSTGGLIGQLATDWSGNETEVKINGNFINLSSLTAFTPDGEPSFDGQYDTFHRVVGASCANEEPAPIFDENYNIIGYEDSMVETILGDNYVADILARGNTGIADGVATTEGKSVSSEALGKDFFETLGYAFGNNTDAPWSELSVKSPKLYFEKGFILFDHDEYELTVGNDGELCISLLGEQIDDETIGGLQIEIGDESIIEYADISAADGKIIFKVKALKVGTTTVTANYNGQTAQTNISVRDVSGIENVNADVSPSIEYIGGVVVAEGCTIEVYSIAGAKVLDGIDSCDLGRLVGGVYVVSATDKSGHRSSFKVMR